MVEEKKVNQEEIMSEEELNGVAGGTVEELVKDIKFLNAVGIKTKNYSMNDLKNNAFDIGHEIANLIGGNFDIWANEKFGNDYRITATSMGMDDTYLTRSEFYKKVCEQVGKPNFDYEKYL